MTDAQARDVALHVLDQLKLLETHGKLQTHQLADIRSHLEHLTHSGPPPVVARKPPSVPQTPALKQCKAIWSYNGADTDELTFHEMDRIEIIEEVDAAWWRGCVVRPDASRSQPGLFPSNYVEEVRQNNGVLSPSLPARNVPPIYSPSPTHEQQSTYNDDKQMQGYHGQAVIMPSPYGNDQNQNSLGPPRWQPGVARWSSGGPPAMPPPPPGNGYSSPPIFDQPPPSPAPSNQGYYQNVPQGPSNPAQYGTQQPVVHTEEEKKKYDKLKKFGGRMGQTMAGGFAGGVGFGIGSHLFD